MPGRRALAQKGVHHRGVGNVREREALGREPHTGAARIIERPQVRAHAVVMRDAAIGVERERSTCRRRTKPRHTRRERSDESAGADRRTADCSTARRAIPASPPVAPPRCCRRARPRTGRPCRRCRSCRASIVTSGANAGSARRIVHVGEHEVLPDENAELVAQIVEGVGLVHHGAADAQHVHARVSQALERGTVAGEVGIETGEVEWSPAHAAAEHGDAIDDEAEPFAFGAAIHLQGPEPHPPEIDDRRLRRWHSIDSRSGYSGCWPCVCGHQRSARGTRTVA